MKTLTLPIAFFFSCALIVSSPLAWAKLYKWVDEKGNVSFSDQVPPEEAKHRRETLNKDGRTVEVTEQAKSKEEQERERSLSELRKKQERIIKSQKKHDDSLLRTYHSKEEMENELQVKLKPMQDKIKLYETEIVNHTQFLDSKQKEAASYERNAKTVPPNLIDEIKDIQTQIDKIKQDIADHQTRQEKLKEEYATNIKRFLVLNQSENGSSDKNQIASIEEAEALGLFHCTNDHQCAKAWEIARGFVDAYSTTPADVNTDKLIMHAVPSRGSDYSLSISRITGKNDEVLLFLDIHCHESSLGEELCQSKKIQELRSSFRPYVNERLINKVPTP